ncbi:MAG TPA: HAD hydrolase family protein [Gemmataceae bacterium]|jgi:hypothetical protein
MRFMALATDYDGTLASEGKVSEQTSEAVRRLRASGRKLILVTGRELDDLNTICEELEIFVGDAENDPAFLDFCECSAAVANALPTLKQHADMVTHGAEGQGVVELIHQLLDDDLRHVKRLSRHHSLVGRQPGIGPPGREGIAAAIGRHYTLSQNSSLPKINATNIGIPGGPTDNGTSI